MKTFVALLLLTQALAAVCQAPVTPPDPAPLKRHAIAEKFILDRLAIWQERLQLRDWKITLLTSHPSELRAGTLGNIRWDLDGKTAVIRVLDASDYKTSFPSALKDMEFTVVHELIHLEFATMARTDESRREEEYAVNHMADALLHLDHGEAWAQVATGNKTTLALR